MQILHNVFLFVKGFQKNLGARLDMGNGRQYIFRGSRDSMPQALSQASNTIKFIFISVRKEDTPWTQAVMARRQAEVARVRHLIHLACPDSEIFTSDSVFTS